MIPFNISQTSNMTLYFIFFFFFHSNKIEIKSATFQYFSHKSYDVGIYYNWCDVIKKKLNA